MGEKITLVMKYPNDTVDGRTMTEDACQSEDLPLVNCMKCKLTQCLGQ
jgi:hypothetical protein